MQALYLVEGLAIDLGTAEDDNLVNAIRQRHAAGKVQPLVKIMHNLNVFGFEPPIPGHHDIGAAGQGSAD